MHCVSSGHCRNLCQVVVALTRVWERPISLAPQESGWTGVIEITLIQVLQLIIIKWISRAKSVGVTDFQGCSPNWRSLEEPTPNRFRFWSCVQVLRNAGHVKTLVLFHFEIFSLELVFLLVTPKFAQLKRS